MVIAVTNLQVISSRDAESVYVFGVRSNVHQEGRAGLFFEISDGTIRALHGHLIA